MRNESLENRIKEYEEITQIKLMKRQPVIIRVDGRGFSSYTKDLVKPFDEDLSKIFQAVCLKLPNIIDNIKFIYSQSDEINILLTDWDSSKEELKLEPNWYNYRVQKIVSIVSAEVTRLFNIEAENIVSKYWSAYMSKYITYEEEQKYKGKYGMWKDKRDIAVFDARAFNIPENEMTNYFIYRQKDAIRNSQYSFIRKYYTNDNMQEISIKDALQEILENYKVDYYKLPLVQQRGFCVITGLGKDEEKVKLDLTIPEFSSDYTLIDRYKMKV